MGARFPAFPVVVSTTAHVAALLWLGNASLPAATPLPTEPALVEVEVIAPRDLRRPEPEPPEPDPLEPETFEPEPQANPVARPPPAVASQPPREPRVTAHQPSDAARVPPSGERPAPASARLTMRRGPSPGDRVDRGGTGTAPPVPSAADAARTIEPEPGPPPPPSPLDLPDRGRPAPVRSELRPDGNGTYRTDDTVFVARVDRSGHVHIEDKPNFHAHLRLPGPRTIINGIEDWYEDPYGTATRDERAVETHTVPIVGGGFDLTDWAMRSSGQDPYYYRKAAFLDRTREERAAMSENDTAANLRDSLAQLPRFLGEVWSDTRWSATQRRQLLFELWDECAESGPAAVVDTAKSARATIMAFIRRRLGPDSPDRYTEAELSTLNTARKSKQRFAPYDQPEGG